MHFLFFIFFQENFERSIDHVLRITTVKLIDRILWNLLIITSLYVKLLERFGLVFNRCNWYFRISKKRIIQERERERDTREKEEIVPNVMEALVSNRSLNYTF